MATASSSPGKSSRCARLSPPRKWAAASTCWRRPIRKPNCCATSNTTTTHSSRRSIRLRPPPRPGTPLPSNGSARPVRNWLPPATQRDAAAQQLEKATRHKDLVRLAASEDSVVLQMAKLSVGSVLKEGDPLLFLAPLRSPVEVEARINDARCRLYARRRSGDDEARRVQLRRARHGRRHRALDQRGRLYGRRQQQPGPTSRITKSASRSPGYDLHNLPDRLPAYSRA